MNRVKTSAGHDIVFNAAERAGHWVMTREAGAEVRTRLVEELSKAHPDDTVVIDFVGMQAMTYSFADEFIGKFLVLRDAEVTPAIGVILRDLAPDPLETIELVLERRSQCVVLVEPDGCRLIDGGQYLAETYDAAVALGTFRASEIAAQLSITPQNANNRLKKMSGMGVLHRERASNERGGREFSYRAVH